MERAVIDRDNKNKPADIKLDTLQTAVEIFSGQFCAF